MARSTHPDKAIEAAVAFAESRGWRYVHSSGHPWGRLFCPGKIRGACIISVSSTPQSGPHHANRIRRKVTACPH